MTRYTIELARKIFKEHFEEDEDFRRVYRDNIAVLLYDRYGIEDYEERNKAANDIMGFIFDAKEIKKKKEEKINRFEINRFEIMDFD